MLLKWLSALLLTSALMLISFSACKKRSDQQIPIPNDDSGGPLDPFGGGEETVNVTLNIPLEFGGSAPASVNLSSLGCDETTEVEFLSFDGSILSLSAGVYGQSLNCTSPLLVSDDEGAIYEGLLSETFTVEEDMVVEFAPVAMSLSEEGSVSLGIVATIGEGCPKGEAYNPATALCEKASLDPEVKKDNEEKKKKDDQDTDITIKPKYCQNGADDC